MPANRYEFVDRWYIPHPIGDVWDALARTGEFTAWWKGVYLECREIPLSPPLPRGEAEERPPLPKGDIGGFGTPEPMVGTRTEVLARGKLPYKLRATFENTRLERPTLIEFKATGDFNTDASRWILKEAQGGGTDVTLEWNPMVDKPIIKLLSPILKPLFRWNHRWTMKRGERQLSEYLASRKAQAGG